MRSRGPVPAPADSFGNPQVIPALIHVGKVSTSVTTLLK